MTFFEELSARAGNIIQAIQNWISIDITDNFLKGGLILALLVIYFLILKAFNVQELSGRLILFIPFILLLVELSIAPVFLLLIICMVLLVAIYFSMMGLGE